MTVDELLANLNATINEIEENEQKINEKQQKSKDELHEMYTPNEVEKQITDTSNQSDSSFNMGYDRAPGNMQEVNCNEIKEYFLSKGGTVKTVKGQEVYEITINGDIYEYFSNSKALHVNGEAYTKCRFYKTPNTQLGKIDNTITILPGSGGTSFGAVDKGNGGLNANANLNDGCLVIETYYDDGHYNMYKKPDKVILPTYLGNFLANGSTTKNQHVRNSIVGYSVGSIAAFNLAAEAPKGYFNSLVAVDLGSHIQLKDGKYEDTITDSDYEKIKDMEIIFMSTIGNDNWHDQSTAQTYRNLKNHGAQNISLYSNCNNFFNPDKKQHYIPDAIKTNWDYTKHNQGYDLIEDTNILSYLSR